MTPQEQELIQNVANKLKASPNAAKDADAERLIKQEISSQEDIVYKLTQAVLVQEMALKNLKAKSDFLEQQVEHYKAESERGALSRMMGGKNPPPVAPAPMQQPSAFGSFMQTAAGIAAGMVVGNLVSDMLFGGDDAAQTATAAATEAVDAVAEPIQETAAAAQEAIAEPFAAVEDGASSFLGDNADFASEFNVANTDFSDTFTNAGFNPDDSFGGFAETSAFGDSDDFGGFDDEI